MSLFEKSHYIWALDAQAGRNDFVSFEQTVCPSDSSPVFLHLFADTRFRLWVNEKFVAYGPGRFVTQFPEYDSYELSGLLTESENLIRVEVNYYGCSSFQSMPDGEPGFIAAGGSEDGMIDFSTPGQWQARIHKAWLSEATLFSFAQNPAEICDTRSLQAELEDSKQLGPVLRLSEGECPWGPLEERSVPYPDYEKYEPEQLELVAGIIKSKTYGLQTIQASWDSSRPRLKRALSTWIHSEDEQSMTLGCFWGELYCNGQIVPTNAETSFGNHLEAKTQLKAGWNLIVASFELPRQIWSYLLRPEAESDISLHALPDLNCTESLAASPIDAEAPTLPDHQLPFSLPDGWTTESGDIAGITPARLAAWDQVDESAARRKIPFSDLSAVDSQMGESVTWCVKFPHEYYGQPVIEVEAPAGTIMDVSYDDWLREDGCVNLFNANPFTDTTDRFILKGGRQRVDVLNPRGGIYLQITFRSPRDGEANTFKLLGVYIQDRTTIKKIDGSFKSGLSNFDYAWDAALATLVASTDDAYSDCPWRERGSYIGDSVVGFHLHRITCEDLSVPHRTILNFGRAALPNGQLPSCAPSWHRRTHEDFSLLWILLVHDYWSATGDSQFIEKNWPRILGVLNAPWDSHPSGLWNTDGLNVFIDWGVLREDRQGTANASINILRCGILKIAARMARAVNREEEAIAFEQSSESVEAALTKHLWCEKDGRFRASLSDQRSPALHANIWALYFGIGEPRPLLDYLTPHLRENFKNGVERGQWSGHVELYFLYYTFEALALHGQHELIETLIDEHYGFLEGLHYGTLNECFCRAIRGVGSCCHTWSSGAAVYAHQYILGLRQIEAGNPRNWLLDPRATDRFEAISGSLATPFGPVHVSWKQESGIFHAEVRAPKQIKIDAGPKTQMTLT